jgi:hypothetical protein
VTDIKVNGITKLYCVIIIIGIIGIIYIEAKAIEAGIDGIALSAVCSAIVLIIREAKLKFSARRKK